MKIFISYKIIKLLYIYFLILIFLIKIYKKELMPMKKIILFLLCVGFAFACSEHSHTDFKDLNKTEYNSQLKDKI